MAFETWLALVALFLVGGLTPGPAVILVMSSSFRYGFWPSMMAALGVASANVIWLALAATGAGALAETFPQGFTALKFLGLAVILWLGISIMRAPIDKMLKAEQDVPPKAKLYAKGLALQLSNPLALVTFAGILPLYFDVGRPLLPQYLMMITTLTYLELQGLAIYAGFGRAIRVKLQNPKAARTFNVTIGCVMIIAGCAAILFTS